MKKSYEMDMCSGPILKKVLSFALPLMLSGVLQLLFNAADVIVVGRFAGSQSLAAVGSTTALINLLINIFIGLSIGANVLVARYYGAKSEKDVSETVHTAIAISLVSGAILVFLGLFTSRYMLELMGTPEDVIEKSVIYMRIYFAGMVANLIYNTGAAILRAVGDSKRPLHILMFSCLINIALDILLVVMCGLGVKGAAIATILSQLLSAVLVCICLMRAQDMYRLEWKQVRLDQRMLKRIVRIGFPAGLQSVMYGSSNVIIQAGINSLGTNTVAAWAAYSKIDAVFWMMVNSFGIAITTFVGQNYGAGKTDRVHKGVRSCMKMTVISSALMSVLIYNWGIYAYELFTTDKEVVSIGIDMMRYLSRFYVTYVAIEILSGALRGVGDCWIPMMLCCVGVCALRVGWILIAVPLDRNIFTIMFSYPLTWVITTILFAVYYLKYSRLRVRRKNS